MPTLKRGADGVAGAPGGIGAEQFGGSGRICVHMDLTDPFELQEPGGRFSHTRSDGEQTVISQEGSLGVPKGSSDGFALLPAFLQHILSVKHDMILEKHASLLGDGFDGPHHGGPNHPVV